MIELFDNYKIVIDDTCYALRLYYDRKDKNGNYKFKTIGYYTTLDKALEAFCRELVRQRLETGSHELAEAVTVIRECYKELSDKLNECMPRMEVVVR